MTDASSATDHDHARCIADAITSAERVCAERGERFTALRRRVLELVWHSHRPVGAYDVIEALQKERGKVGPPTVYRALDFLLAQGLVHRIESLSGYVGCARPEHGHHGQFLICRHCGNAEELTDRGVDSALAQAAARADFAVEAQTLELRGLCAICAPEAPEAETA